MLSTLVLLRLFSWWGASPYEGGAPGPGKLVGRVILEKLVAPKKLVVTKDADKCGKEKPDERYVFSADKGLKNVVIWLEGIDRGKALPKAALVIKNLSCVFDPHVAVGAVGSTLEVKNFDALQHNTHVYYGLPVFGSIGSPTPLTSLFSVALPVKGLSVKRKLEKAGLLDLKNDAGRPWMQAYVWVFEHPYATVSDENGEFALDEVPEGDYTLRVWHEAGGSRSASVKVAGGEPVTVHLQF